MKKTIAIMWNTAGLLSWILVTWEFWATLHKTDFMLAVLAVMAGGNFVVDFSKDLRKSIS